MKIIVLCTGNSCRSQMAEGFLKQFLGSDHTVFSAGLKPQGVNPRAITVMAEIGIDISQQTSDNVKDFLKEDFDYILTVCDHASDRCPIFVGGGKRIHISFEDPADAEGSEKEILDKFRNVRDEIEHKLKLWAKSILTS